MRLKQQREAKKKKQREVLLAAKEADPRVDSGLYSKFENGIALPTPQVMRSICRFLRLKPTDIYDRAEVDLVKCMRLSETPAGEQKDKPPRVPKASFSLTDVACKTLETARLTELGYADRREWFYEMIARTEREYKNLSSDIGGETNE